MNDRCRPRKKAMVANLKKKMVFPSHLDRKTSVNRMQLKKMTEVTLPVCLFTFCDCSQCSYTINASSLPYSGSCPTTWQCRVRPCHSDIACSHRPGVSSSRSSLCSSPAPPCFSPLAAAGTPRSWPPGCATVSVCSSSCLPSQQKCTNKPQQERRLLRGSGRGPSASKKVGNSVGAAPLGTPVRELGLAQLKNTALSLIFCSSS